jgi:hypothetical protein
LMLCALNGVLVYASCVAFVAIGGCGHSLARGVFFRRA